MLPSMTDLREGGSLVKRSADGLMDRALEPEAQALIRNVFAEFEHQAIRFDHVVTRRAGQRRTLPVLGRQAHLSAWCPTHLE